MGLKATESALEARALLQTRHRSGGSAACRKSMSGETSRCWHTPERAVAGIRDLARPSCSEKAALAVAPGGSRGDQEVNDRAFQ